MWLGKSLGGPPPLSDADPKSGWPALLRLCEDFLPHATSWTEVLRLAREDGGIDIKDDCRLDGASARCHQDGSNAVAKGYAPLVRLAINVSSHASGRSLDYLQVANY